MKKLLLATAALALATGTASAADLPRRAAPPPVFTPVPVFTWTGFYAGLETTYVWNDRSRATTTSPSAVLDAGVADGSQRTRNVALRSYDGLANIGGGGGYNYQFTPGSGIVVGAAVNIDWVDQHRNSFSTSTAGNVSRYGQGLEYLGTVTGRVGYAWDRFLVYGTGGLAFGSVDNSADFYGPGVGAALRYTGGERSFRTGFAYGGGVEYAIPEDSFLNYLSVGKYLGIKSNAVTLKAEYLHYDLGSHSIFAANQPGFTAPGYRVRFRDEGNLVRVGFNYKFGG
ncbi:outer membrane protein [Methylobacterium brachythecii]|uniref:Membrane protein n=1 Tax=Methylobacterium brachythecii TaxID=1176177 RepID=A0A7W6ANF7_9HYPH|nr:porin family protein [Methylobacterium brachythecii]MBB3905019.1 outer membrane immunogenic protein [Methylobacterium brachythecii]GLS46288.1 membrane protein [Methylobacterium brachythecii]